MKSWLLLVFGNFTISHYCDGRVFEIFLKIWIVSVKRKNVANNCLQRNRAYNLINV